MTWLDVAAFVKKAHLDRSEYFRSEYFSPSRGVLDEVGKDTIWPGKGRPCAYWMAGGSEGWYVHVDAKRSGVPRDTHENILLGKFWTAADAAFAADLVSRFMNGVFKSVDDLVAEGVARFP
jgi:hypothetical protein